jgi:hypothetical protein
MSRKITIAFEVEVPVVGSGAGQQAISLAEAVIVGLLPRLAAEAGIEQHRLVGHLLVELGYVVGLSHAPLAAVDALAVATERMRDAMADKRERTMPKLPVPTVPAPASLH